MHLGLKFLVHIRNLFISIVELLLDKYYLFIESFVAVLEMPHAIMKISELSLVCPRASATTHDKLFAKCVDMNQIVFLSNQLKTKLTVKLCFFTLHPMRLEFPSPHHLFTKVAFSQNKDANVFMSFQIWSWEFSCTSFIFSTAINHLKLTQACLMLLNSVIRKLLITAIFFELTGYCEFW